jgi:hypothetical protein
MDSICCICNPAIKINPHVCHKHKLEARSLAKRFSMFVSQALGELYLGAKSEVA